jgi:hypothetical protein
MDEKEDLPEELFILFYICETLTFVLIVVRCCIWVDHFGFFSITESLVSSICVDEVEKEESPREVTRLIKSLYGRMLTNQRPGIS